MPQPVRRHEEVPIVDPAAIEAAYRRERARRRARVAHRRAQRAASFRFLGVVVFLLALSIVVVVTIWREAQKLFGL